MESVKRSTERIEQPSSQDHTDTGANQESCTWEPNDSENVEPPEAFSLNSSAELLQILREADSNDPIPPEPRMTNPEKQLHRRSFIDFLDEIGNNLSLAKLYKWIDETRLELPALLIYCQHALTDLELSKSSLSRVTAVLLHFEMHPEHPNSEPLMKALLGPVLQELIQEVPVQTNMNPKLYAVVELVYDACCKVPIERGIARLAPWVMEQAFSARNEMEPAELEYMRAFSAALWSLAQGGKGQDLAEIITPDRLRHLYTWSTKLDPRAESKLKSIVDFMICSVCYCRPWLVVYLMYLMDLFKIQKGIDLNGRILTDWLEKCYNEGNIWKKLVPSKLRSSMGDLDLGGLHILRAAILSPPALHVLRESPLLAVFNFAIRDFCKAYASPPIEPRPPMESIMTTIQLLQILEFYGRLCILKDIRIWLGTGPGSFIWFPLLKLLSTQSAEIMSSESRGLANHIAVAVRKCLQNLCWVHAPPEHLERVAHYVRDIIKTENKISPFCKFLLVSLFLDDEKIFVRVQSKTKVAFKEPYNRSEGLYEDLLPHLGIKGMNRVLLVRIDTTITDMIQDSTNLSLRLTSCPNIEIPLDSTMKKLLAVERYYSKAGQPFLDMLELTLKDESPLQSNRNALTVYHIPTPLEVFGKAGGFLELFQRLHPPAPLDNTIACLRQYCLDLPLYLEVFLGQSFNYRANCLIRRAMGLSADAMSNNIPDQLASLHFEVLEKLLEMFPPSTDGGRNLRSKIKKATSVLRRSGRLP